MDDVKSETQSPRYRRGRPSRKEAEAIDRKILDAALACFLDTGFDGTTMEGIAVRAGVTKTTLYLRYPAKDQLLGAVIQSRRDEWGASSRRTDWMTGDTLEARLKYLARILVERNLDDEVRAFIKLLDGLYGSANVIARGAAQKLRQPMLERIAEEISEYAAKDLCAVRDPATAAAIFLGMISGYSLVGEPEGAATLEKARAFADYCVDIFLSGRSAW